MQKHGFYEEGTAQVQPLPAQHARPAWLITGLLVLVTAVIVGGSLCWIQWAGQRSIALRYPVPRIQMKISSASPLLRTQSYQFSATASGRELSYRWDFGDQNTAIGASASHIYETTGSFVVTLIVTDPAGHYVTHSTTVNVVPPPPQASFTFSGGYGWFVYFDASGSTADASTSLASYNWDFGDGTTDSTSYSQETHSYNNPGVYQVTLTVVDATGQSSSVYTASVTLS